MSTISGDVGCVVEGAVFVRPDGTLQTISIADETDSFPVAFAVNLSQAKSYQLSNWPETRIVRARIECRIFILE
jgi:hypothetical protein